MKRLAVLALCAACGARGATGDGGGRLTAVVAPQDRDTVRFEAAAMVRRCARRPGSFLLEGLVRGNGVLVLLRDGDPPNAGEYPLLGRGDTVTQRGAVVVVRFLIGDVAHGALLDSGVVRVARHNGRLVTDLRGKGLETAGSLRAGLEARFDNLAPAGAADTVACEVQV